MFSTKTEKISCRLCPHLIHFILKNPGSFYEMSKIIDKFSPIRNKNCFPCRYSEDITKSCFEISELPIEDSWKTMRSFVHSISTYNSVEIIRISIDDQFSLTAGSVFNNFIDSSLIEKSINSWIKFIEEGFNGYFCEGIRTIKSSEYYNYSDNMAEDRIDNLQLFLECYPFASILPLKIFEVLNKTLYDELGKGGLKKTFDKEQSWENFPLNEKTINRYTTHYQRKIFNYTKELGIKSKLKPCELFDIFEKFDIFDLSSTDPQFKSVESILMLEPEVIKLFDENYISMKYKLGKINKSSKK